MKTNIYSLFLVFLASATYCSANDFHSIIANQRWGMLEEKDDNFDLIFSNDSIFESIYSYPDSKPERIKGNYSITKDTLILDIEKCEMSGKYKLTFKNDTLLIVSIFEKCWDRKEFTQGIWRKINIPY